MFGSYFPSLEGNRMRNKQEAAEECRIQKHSIILGNTKLKEQGIWRVTKTLEERDLPVTVRLIAVFMGKGAPRFLLTKALSSFSFPLTFLAFPSSFSLHPSPTPNFSSLFQF